ncbi:hypothetical protein, partial [Bacillus cereus]|uniref:hypothetical protein n=1 Tax=Bacillus cereus TaxID=1396 RepID=UPI0034D5A546
GGTYSGGKRNPTPGDTRSATAAGRYGEDGRLDPSAFVQPSGRWPANVILDEEAGAMLDEQTRSQTSRFFYCAKASKSERNAAGPNAHP